MFRVSNPEFHRQKRSVTNDADRLKKYLAKFELDFAACGEREK